MDHNYQLINGQKWFTFHSLVPHDQRVRMSVNSMTMSYDYEQKLKNATQWYSW